MVHERRRNSQSTLPKRAHHQARASRPINQKRKTFFATSIPNAPPPFLFFSPPWIHSFRPSIPASDQSKKRKEKTKREIDGERGGVHWMRAMLVGEERRGGDGPLPRCWRGAPCWAAWGGCAPAAAAAADASAAVAAAAAAPPTPPPHPPQRRRPRRAPPEARPGIPSEPPPPPPWPKLSSGDQGRVVSSGWAETNGGRRGLADTGRMEVAALKNPPVGVVFASLFPLSLRRCVCAWVRSERLGPGWREREEAPCNILVSYNRIKHFVVFHLSQDGY